MVSAKTRRLKLIGRAFGEDGLVVPWCGWRSRWTPTRSRPRKQDGDLGRPRTRAPRLAKDPHSWRRSQAESSKRIKCGVPAASTTAGIIPGSRRASSIVSPAWHTSASRGVPLELFALVALPIHLPCAFSLVQMGPSLVPTPSAIRGVRKSDWRCQDRWTRPREGAAPGGVSCLPPPKARKESC